MKLHLASAALVSAALVSGCTVTLDSQSEIVRDEKRFTVSGTPDVRVTTFDGSIRIQAWDKPGVLIEIEKRGPTRESVNALQITSTQDGNVIELEVKRARTESFRGLSMHRTPSAGLIVSVPRHANIRARSGDGSIHVESVEGKLDLRTGDGSIRATDVSGDLTFQTGDGSVTVDKVDGRLGIDTGDGSVSVSGKLASLKLHTGDGSVVLRADSSSAMTDDWDINTGDGSVSVYLPESFGSELDARTGDGTVHSDLTSFVADGTENSRRRLRGKIGAGGKLFRIRTGDGTIKLRTQ